MVIRVLWKLCDPTCSLCSLRNSHLSDFSRRLLLLCVLLVQFLTSCDKKIKISDQKKNNSSEARVFIINFVDKNDRTVLLYREDLNIFHANLLIIWPVNCYYLFTYEKQRNFTDMHFLEMLIFEDHIEETW